MPPVPPETYNVGTGASQWFDKSTNANKLRQSYLKGYLDISGGGIQIRTDNSLNFFGPSDTVSAFGITSRNLHVPIPGTTTFSDLSINKLYYIKDLNQNVQIALDDLSHSLQSYETLVDTYMSFGGPAVSLHTDIIPDSNDQLNLGSSGSEFKNLWVHNIAGPVTLLQDVSANGRLFVSSDASFGGKVAVVGDVSLNSRLAVAGVSTFSRTVIAASDISANSRLFVGSDASFGAKLFVAGDTSLNTKLRVGGTTLLMGATTVLSDLSAGARLSVGSDASFGGKLWVNSDVSMGSNVDIAGVLRVGQLVIGSGGATDNSGMSISQKLILFQDISVNTSASIGTTLNVGGVSTLSDNLITLADVSANSRLFVGSDASFGRKFAVVGDTSLNSNLTVGGLTVLTGRATALADISANARLFVGSDASFGGKFLAVGDTSLNSNLTVGGVTVLTGRATALADISANARLFVGSDASFGGKFLAVGDTSLNSKLTVGGVTVLTGQATALADISANARLFVGSDASFGGKLFVTSDASLNSKLSVGDTLSVNNLSTLRGGLTVGDSPNTPATKLYGSLTVGDSDYGANPYSSTTLNGKLYVGQDVSLNGKLFVAGDSSFNGNLQIANDKSLIARALNIYDLSVNHTLQATNLFINGPQYNGTSHDNAISTMVGDINIIPASASNSVHIRGDLIVDGSINFMGLFQQNNTVINVTEALDISNNGTTSTLNVTQNGSKPIARFNDVYGTVVYIDYTGKVGIGGSSWSETNLPHAELDVSGNTLLEGNVTYLGTLADTFNNFTVTDGNITTKGLTVNTYQASFQQGITADNGIAITTGNLVLTSGSEFGFVDQSDGTW
jgi:predicted acyltransferase (DUF342 family)